MTDLLATLAARGLLQDHTPGLPARVATGRPLRGYVGFDPTADSLHVGNLVPVMALYWLQATGGTPLALVGGGTGLIGDPSGKRSERPMLTAETIAANAAAIGAQLDRLLPPVGDRQPVRMRNNADWLQGLGMIEFLRETGKHFTVNYMLQKDSVKSRMESGISYTEFSYMLLQAHDFAHLHRAEGCELQMGGSDQWGNITAGIELIGRRDGGEAHGLVAPLLTTASGAKFGKSEDGNIWLDPARTSPYRFYQFWLHTDDRDVERLLKCCTILELEAIATLMAEQAADPGRRVAQRRLAEEMTRRVHGEQRLAWVISASEILFGEGALRDAGLEVLEVVAGEVTTVPVDRGALQAGHPLVEALVATGLAASKAEARRGLAQRAYAVADAKIEDPDYRLSLGDAIHERYVILRKGRRHCAMLQVADSPPG